MTDTQRPLRDRLLITAGDIIEPDVAGLVLEAVDEIDRLTTPVNETIRDCNSYVSLLAERDRIKVEQQQHLKTIAELRELNTNQYDQITKLEMANARQKKVIDTLRKCLDVAVKKLAYLGFVEDIERIAKIKEDGGIK